MDSATPGPEEEEEAENAEWTALRQAEAKLESKEVLSLRHCPVPRSRDTVSQATEGIHNSTTQQRALRGTKRRIPNGLVSLPLTLQAASIALGTLLPIQIVTAALMTPSTPTPSSTQYNSADLTQPMAEITARYNSWWEYAEPLIELGNTPPLVSTPVLTVQLVSPRQEPARRCWAILGDGAESRRRMRPIHNIDDVLVPSISSVSTPTPSATAVALPPADPASVFSLSVAVTISTSFFSSSRAHTGPAFSAQSSKKRSKARGVAVSGVVLETKSGRESTPACEAGLRWRWR